MDIPTTHTVAQIEAGGTQQHPCGPASGANSIPPNPGAWGRPMKGRDVTTEPAWLADPTGRHQTRYWNGRNWTEHVADNGVAGVDPPTMPPPPSAPVPFPAPAPFVAPAPQSHSAQQSGARKWLVIAIPVVVIASIIAVVVVRDSKPSTSSGGVGASGGVGTGGGKGVSVEYTDANGYQYVVTHTGEVQLQRSTVHASPGFAVVDVTGGKMSVANANSGRNAPMPVVDLLAYVKVPDCDTETSLFGAVETKVSLPDSCFLEIHSDWSIDANDANGIGEPVRDGSIDLDQLLGAVLRPGQTAVADVDASWFQADASSTVPDTLDVSGPFVWGILVGDGAFDGPTSCVIRLVGSNTALLQELTESVGQIQRTNNLGIDQFTCDVVAG